MSSTGLPLCHNGIWISWLPSDPLTPYNTLSSTNHTMTTATRLTANQAKSAIYDLADLYSWQTVAAEMIARMSGDEARDFLEDFTRLYAD